ncbi:tetratricopeptide repeat protein [Neisseria montereyensis]|uniref:Tetratricopeptide repeat protein n=1 Tax=Neisseria montereyensis TaxID=2973938 RepID=A0ABT2F9Q2_9NEIS|nr:tetratricopeptide repeat protein [Neisseria montereyensis]MCS4532924.1 tetratricopeptide repeat protein [Neisseria montereyensis]
MKSAQEWFEEGVNLYKQNDLDGAIEAWSNIQPKDSPKLYIQAQVNLGAALDEQGKLNEAIEAYRNIQPEDSPELYAIAQFNLGNTLRKQNDLDGAIKAYRNIQPKDSPEVYIQAQVNLGAALDEQGKLNEAIEAYRNIQPEDSPEAYAIAQFNLGNTLREQNDFDEAIKAYRNIQPEDSLEVYIRAQVNLGAALAEQEKLNEAIEAYRNIQHKGSPEQYAKAQFNLGNTLRKQNDLDGAIKAYRNIQSEDSVEIYAQALLSLGMLLVEQQNIDEAIEIYKNIDVKYQYHFLIKLMNIISNCNKKYFKKLLTIIKKLSDLMDELFVFSESKYELKVAHYSRGSTIWNMIVEENPSAFRLNTIKNVNDPMEGLVLNQYLQKSCQPKNELLPQPIIENTKNQQQSVFISCFTFNHDSLNQFRLYGKEQEREASGVSLVFAKDFFNYDQRYNINFIASNKELEIGNKNLSINKKESNSGLLLNKLPLYRCIYIDPETGYLSLACRDQITFYHEILAGNPTQDFNKLFKEANKQWNNYQKEISTKTKEIKTLLKTIITNIKHLNTALNRSKKEEKEEIFETLNLILLPLQYLVKHAAFQEEQECRIMYITQLSDKKIQMDWKNKQMYVEYEPNVKENIDKIYLSPGAKSYEDFFRKVLNDNGDKKKVRISTNPFRNK